MTTRPTADELKNLEPGRYFTARLRKKASTHDGVTAYTSDGYVVPIPFADITHIEPAQLKVGDRVIDGTADDPRGSGEIIHINGDMAWVAWPNRLNDIRHLSSLKVAR